MKISLIIRKCLKLIVLEGWPIVLLILALIVEISHVVNSGWLNLYLYNGDSLTLPILLKTLTGHSGFLWVSSSQFLLFPEGLLYLVSSFLNHSVRASLLINSFLNIVILYLIFRWFVEIVSKTPRYTKQIFAVACCLVLILCLAYGRF